MPLRFGQRPDLNASDIAAIFPSPPSSIAAAPILDHPQGREDNRASRVAALAREPPFSRAAAGGAGARR
eukprot:7742413-Pyramimonas_sp.AAC.1